MQKMKPPQPGQLWYKGCAQVSLKCTKLEHCLTKFIFYSHFAKMRVTKSCFAFSLCISEQDLMSLFVPTAGNHIITLTEYNLFSSDT